MVIDFLFFYYYFLNENQTRKIPCGGNEIGNGETILDPAPVDISRNIQNKALFDNHVTFCFLVFEN